ncbi:hypothetical protein HNQ80_001322 [Anaerosolibacter carboniphilus]|uniref:Uncharacterized protein n=1 Tax=Anaerosolibacter carboniphilus TaxID=1417629 RepID=A0A841KP91_9FIRM|nr:hypothetical protein [Anaerosolibacter carboniphilus]
MKPGNRLFYKAAVPIPAIYVYILADERSAYRHDASFSVKGAFLFWLIILLCKRNPLI